MQQRRSNAKICTALGKNTFNIMYDLNLQVSDHGNKNIMYHFNYSNDETIFFFFGKVPYISGTKRIIAVTLKF
jgi:hypothetical protein